MPSHITISVKQYALHTSQIASTGAYIKKPKIDSRSMITAPRKETTDGVVNPKQGVKYWTSLSFSRAKAAQRPSLGIVPS